MKGKAWRGLLNPLVAAQNFEYKVHLTPSPCVDVPVDVQYPR
jgi:hypothetical protein